MNKAEIVEALASKLGTQKQQAKEMLDAYIDVITESLVNKENVVLVGFGTLYPHVQNSRMARNPKTGTPVEIKPRVTAKFKPGKYLLNAINHKGN